MREDLKDLASRTVETALSRGADAAEVSIFRDTEFAVTVRNEIVRLPYFLDYYRRLGAGHFLVVDNGSDDGTHEYLADQPDVSV